MTICLWFFQNFEFLNDNMEKTKYFSPFYEIRKALMLFRFTFGFPLQDKNDTLTGFRFVGWLECLRLLPLIILPLSGILFFIILSSIHGQFFSIKDVVNSSYETYSTNAIDIFLSLVWPFVSVILSIFQVMNFKDSAQHFNCLIKEVIEIKTMLIGDLSSTKDIPPKKTVHSRERNSSKIVIYGQICNSLVAIFFGVWFYNVLLITSKQSIFQKFGFGYYWPFCLVFGISFFFSLYGPMACTAEFLICHLIDTITNLFRDWKLSLDDNQKFAQPNPLEQVADDVTSNSFEIHDK